MLLLVPQQFKEPVIISGVGRLAAPALAEDELIVHVLVRGLETGAMHIDPFFTALRAPQDHLVALADVAVLHHGQVAVITDHHAGIHTALLRQDPFPVDLEVLGVHGGAVVVVRRHAVLLRCGKGDVGRVHELRLGKIGRVIGWHIKRHGTSSYVLTV